MRIEGSLSGGGRPVAGVRLELFQTDAEGYYRRGPDGRDLGREQARLAGVTNVSIAATQD